MKKKIYIASAVAAFVLICTIVITRVYLNNVYNSAITLIQNCSYEDALTELEKTSFGVLNRGNFTSDYLCGRLDKLYKNTLELYAYSLARNEYNSDDRNMDWVEEYLRPIHYISYDGELCEEINTFTENFHSEYEEFVAEKESLAKYQEYVSKREEAERLKSSPPYVGMSESDIGKTLLGEKYTKSFDHIDIDGMSVQITEYNFKNDEGGIIFIAKCRNDKVISVLDFRDRPLYRINYKSLFPKKSTSDKDDYNAKDYDDPEDFYDDNYDDFGDYEDAEDYYYEHCD